MSLPVLLTSDMLGAPNLTPTNGSLNALLLACLVNGFNTQAVSSAVASGGVVTFNFASAPGFSTLDTVTVAGASNATVNGQFRVQSTTGNQVSVAIVGVPDGAVSGAITLKFSPLGWTRPYSGTGIGCCRQGGSSTTKRFLRVFDNNVAASSYQGFVRGYESMTAVSTGTGAFPTTTQRTGNGEVIYLPSDGTGDQPALQLRSWVVVGTLPGILTMFESPFSNGAPAPAFGAELSNIPGVTGRVKLLRNAYMSYGDAAFLLDEDWGDV